MIRFGERRHRLILVALALYLGLFFVATEAAGAGPITAVLPIAAIAWGFGMRAGLIAAVASFPANALLVTVAGESAADVMGHSAGLVGAVALVFVGGVVGRHRDLGGELTESRTSVAVLRRRLEFEDVLTELSRRFVTVDVGEIDAATSRAQELVAGFLGAERSMIYEYGDLPGSTKVVSNWAAAGLPRASVETRQNPRRNTSWTADLVVNQKRPIVISRLADLPPEASPEKELLSKDGVKSFIAQPLISDGELFGLLSFETVTHTATWTTDDVVNLEAAAQLFAAVRERRRVEIALRKTARVLSAITACNEAVVRATDEGMLLDDVCRIIVEEGSYRLAWVGLTDSTANGTVRPVAMFEDSSGLVDSLDIVSSDIEGGRGPASTALRELCPASIPNIAQWVDEGPARETAESRGYVAALGLPLLAGDNMLGVLTVYAPHQDAFEGDAKTVLVRLADDLAFGIAALRSDAKRRQVEAQLRELVRSKDQFVASVAHELRTPLTAVVGLAHELKDRPGDFKPEEASDLMETIVRESEEVASIVDDLLVIARADIGKVRVNLEPTDLGVEICRVLTGLPKDSRERLECPEVGLVAWADPARVRQIIRNLMVNALRYGGERIKVETGLVGDTVVLRVADTGSPIPSERQRSMFDPYVGSQESSLTASIGLGLPVSLTLARLMDGEISYRHDKDWSIFELTLPAGQGNLSAVATGSQL